MRSHSATARLVIAATTLVVALVVACATSDAGATPRWHIEKPVTQGQPTPQEDAPLRKDEAAEKALEARYPVFRIDVEAHRERTKRPPGTVEQRFANVLNRGNPEVEGGQIRHGAFYDGLFYWGSDPLSFIWLNVANRLRDR